MWMQSNSFVAFLADDAHTHTHTHTHICRANQATGFLRSLQSRTNFVYFLLSYGGVTLRLSLLCTVAPDGRNFFT